MLNFLKVRHVFFKDPYIPDKKVKTVLIDGREKLIGHVLNNFGIQTIYTGKNEFLYDAISYHPDIILHNAGDGEVVIAPNVSVDLIFNLKKLKLNTILGQSNLNRNYPGNIAYNVARLGGYAFHNLKYTDPVLREMLENKGVKFIHVNQGYTKCNMAIIDEFSFITSDYGIYKIADKYGFDCLLIEPGNIMLEGFKHGFIGGAAGLISKNIFCITGKLSYHNDSKKIVDFLTYKNKKIIYLTPFQIKDIGSIIPLN
jgi:hypothetical protein